MSSAKKLNISVKVYHGYGHAENLFVLGHVLKSTPPPSATYAKGVLRSIWRLIRLFLVKPVPGARLRLVWNGEAFYTTTESDGYFKFEWKAKDGIKAGWHHLTVDYVNDKNEVLASGNGKLFVPHITQYAFISDIDDTVLVSYSATIFKRLNALFLNNPHTRTAFPDVVEHYRQLAFAKTEKEVPNPFYFVSSSEWNLYDDLLSFFEYNRLPQGVFLLNQIKQWYQLLKTGKTKHEGKLLRITRIMEAFPNQQFVLLGDNSQKDPFIYESVVKKYGNKVFAVYIRNVHQKHRQQAIQVLEGLEAQGVHTCFFDHSSQAIIHSKKIGLIMDNDN